VVVAGVVVVVVGVVVVPGAVLSPGPGVIFMPVAGAASVTGCDTVEATGVSPCETRAGSVGAVVGWRGWLLPLPGVVPVVVGVVVAGVVVPGATCRCGVPPRTPLLGVVVAGAVVAGVVVAGAVVAGAVPGAALEPYRIELLRLPCCPSWFP
jgi:hypothetical protein